MIRLFLVDDHTMLREGLRALLSEEPAFSIVGEATNGQSLLDQLPTTPADVVLLDLNMPVLGGVATAERLAVDYPDLRILILSMVEEPLLVWQALAAGAHGYLLKNATKDELVTSIRAVLAGRRFLSSEIGFTLLDKVVNPVTTAKPAAALVLTRREQEILGLVAEGLSTPQIAEQLFTSRRTVETHRQNILEKTGCKNSAALIHYAISHQLLPTSETKS